MDLDERAQKGSNNRHFSRRRFIAGAAGLSAGAVGGGQMPPTAYPAPEGGLHGFRNESGEKASMLILFAPGAPREDYFERVATTGQMSEEERTEFYLRHDTFWV